MGRLQTHSTMQLTLLTPGHLRRSYLREGCEDYAARLERYVRFQLLEVKEESVSQGGDVALARKLEGERLLKRCPPGAVLHALDEHGQEFSSKELAEFFRQHQNRGTRHLAFIIGGPYGLAPEVLERAVLKVSLSRLTLPHELCRLVALEQLYRAFTILQGEPYHNP